MPLLIALFAILGVVAAAVTVNGFVLSVMWGWFVVPVFHLPELGLWQAVGLATVLQLFTGQMHVTREKTEGPGEAFAKLFILPFITLGLGWLVYLLA